MITQDINKVNSYLSTAESTSSCLIILNQNSGKKPKMNAEKLVEFFDIHQPFVVFDGSQSISDYLDIIVSGGDGTISNAVELCKGEQHRLFYQPSGTINDFGKIAKQEPTPIIAKVNGRSFCYVLATGTFTSIGYTAKREDKVKNGKLAYIQEAFKNFKIQSISATITTEKELYSNNYTLIMLLRSPRCFGFNFNRLYDSMQNELYLLLVKTPKNKLTLFKDFFRCFFVGFDKEYCDGDIVFKKVAYADIKLENKCDFCVDGDRLTLSNNIRVNPYRFNGTINTKMR